ncbi:kinase-like domain-containing protein [Aspergillus californicus]
MRAESSQLSQLEGDGLPKTALQELQECLKNNRVVSVTARKPLFIPISVVQRKVDEYLERVLIEESIFDHESIPNFTTRISQDSPRLFAILVDMKRENCIKQFIEEGIDDSNLPFVEPSGSDQAISALLTQQRMPIRTFDGWDGPSLYNFKTKQYRVLSPVFHRGQHYEFDELVILPFIKSDNVFEKDLKAFRAGAYGEVTQERIHPDHHELEDPSAPGDKRKLVVAVKCLFYDKDFEPERKAYQALGTLSHPHLIDLLFTYRTTDGQRRKSHLVLPWADGNMKEYWERTPMPSLTPQYLIWWVKQMAGITNALNHFHEFTNPKIGDSRYGRHGDIKAQNILWFKDANIFKIADLGLANVRGIDSKSNVDPATIVASPTYCPPDADRKSLISRKYDIWSLGCLFSEIISYLVVGSQGIPEFSKQRLNDESELGEFRGDFFYSSDLKTVKPSVSAWFKYLTENPRCSNMMQDILDLVITDMIVIQPIKRCEDHDYLCAPSSRLEKAPMPTSQPASSSNLQACRARATPPLTATKSYTWNC